MARIYKRTDRICVKIDDITVKIAPLTLHQKAEIQHAMILGRTKTDIKEASKGIALAVKYGVKGIDGVQDSDGNPYQLKMDSEGNLSDEAVDDLLNLEMTQKLVMICSGMVNGVQTSFTDSDGKALDGVEIVDTPKQEAELKNV